MRKGVSTQHERREVRRNFLAPVFALWQRSGKKLYFLANQMDVDPRILSSWKVGAINISESQLRRMCIEVGIDRKVLGELPYPFKPRPRRRNA